jgi:sensor histidine kinase regulating citrate/malate metabolism
MLFWLLELTLSKYEKGFLISTKELREQMLSQQYEEIQAVYLNMRGWRHDYHNHIQVLKANLDQEQLENARTYLNAIEDELRRVDTFIKSGNVMADAILNSKLTLAQQKKIAITCDAFLPEELFIHDIDLCTILGNVLDNAIESCEKLSEQDRFIRVYIALQKEQLYISIQNASVQEIDFEQKNYISTKRGNHGLGMKRVAAVVNKWEGYFHLCQEPGVFATEIMIPAIRAV